MPHAQIMVVEDENIVAKDIQSRLKGLDYSVSAIAASGEEAIEKAGQALPDLVLMDIRLRGQIDGVQAAETIRDRYDIPVVYLTAYVDEQTLNRAKLTEPYGYILKPFEERDLHTTIEMALYKHKMESKLKETQQWLATTLRSIGDALIATDTDGVITFMNPVAEKLTGWSEQEALGRDLHDVFQVIDEQSRQASQPPTVRALKQGAVVTLTNGSILVSRHGAEIPIDDSDAPIKDDKGNVTGAVLVFRDITERRLAEEAQQHHQRYLRKLVKQLNCLYAVFCTLEKPGASLEDILIRLVDLIPSAWEYPEIACARAVINGNEFRTENFRQTEWRQAAPIVAGDKHIGELEVCYLEQRGDHDEGPFLKEERSLIDAVAVQLGQIAHRKQTERTMHQTVSKLQQANAQLEQCAAAAAGHIQQSLSAVSNELQQLVRQYIGQIDDEADHLITRALHGVSHVQAMVRDLLLYSQLDTRRQQVQPTDYQAALAQALQALKHKIEHTQAVVTCDALPTLPADEHQIALLFQHLIDNSIKFRSDRQPKIHVGAQCKDDKWLFSIADNGIGIDPQHASDIFTVFRRMVPPQRMSLPGTGIGLAICRKIVEAHGGGIWVESEPGKGSTFHFTIPAP